MADKFGGLALPAPTGDPLVGDPALYYLGHYLRAVLNAQLKDAWKALTLPNAAPAVEALPVRHVFFHNPLDSEFNEADLPALYLHRGESAGEMWADEWDVQRTPITAQWVFPTTMPVEVTRRAPFVNAVGKVAHAAIEAGRHPAYQIPGDTDPLAAAEGSFVYGAGYMNPVAVEFKGARPVMMALRMANGPTRGYPTLEMKLSITELLEGSIDGFAEHTSIEAATETEDGTETARVRFTT